MDTMDTNFLDKTFTKVLADSHHLRTGSVTLHPITDDAARRSLRTANAPDGAGMGGRVQEIGNKKDQRSSAMAKSVNHGSG